MANSRQYRIHFLEGLSAVGVTRMRFASDAEACERAATFPVINTIEVWNGNRKIYRSSAANSGGSKVREDRSSEPHHSASPEANETRERVNGSWRALGQPPDNDQLIDQTRRAIAESRELLARPFFRVADL